MKRTVWTALSLALCLCISGVASAATVLGPTVNLNDLITNNGSVTVGDKTFDSFTYVPNSGDMPAATGVNIIGIQDDAGNYGIRITGGFADIQGGGISDALLTYRVTAGPGRLIKDVHMASNVSIAGPNGFISVTESFFPEDKNVLIDVFEVKPGITQLTDWADLTEPLKSFHVQKDILAFAGTGSGASLSLIDQTFSQVPEPATAMLVLGGIAGLALARRRSN